MSKYPATLNELQEELRAHTKNWPVGSQILFQQTDPVFRLNIVTAQIGDLAEHLTHDPEINPIARPRGTKQSEMSDFGHAVVQLVTYGALRGINLQEAVDTALGNLREKDFVKRGAKNNDDDVVVGQTGCPGKIRGRAFVDPDMSRIPPQSCSNSGFILVTSHPRSDSRLKKYAGIVTDHGGTHCHAAIIAREFGIPCVAGTGNATERIKDGDVIEINAMVEQGQVWKV